MNKSNIHLLMCKQYKYHRYLDNFHKYIMYMCLKFKNMLSSYLMMYIKCKHRFQDNSLKHIKYMTLKFLNKVRNKKWLNTLHIRHIDLGNSIDYKLYIIQYVTSNSHNSLEYYKLHNFLNKLDNKLLSTKYKKRCFKNIKYNLLY